MLFPLISNKSQEKILFFLLLNGKCYAAQLSQRFKVPLTPIQHALNKLERHGILSHYTEGKTRFFTFNPAYPLLMELESLIKKAYTHLSPHEKKSYYNPLFHSKQRRRGKYLGAESSSAQKTLQMVWEKLTQVQALSFSAKSKSLKIHSGWNGIGKGTVDTSMIEKNCLIFQEKGSWVSEENKHFDFSNVFRWNLHLDKGVISLEHLRFGPNHPVFLFSLIPIDEQTLESFDSHVCNSDTYFGQLRYDKHFVQFNWRVIGSNKNEEIDYLYT